MSSSLEAFFLEANAGRRGQRFCVLHEPPTGDPRLAFVYVHPFAEEMNKTRRMAALQARALARAGHAVLQIDLLGCGDSSASFGEATWEGWIGDVVHAKRWMRERYSSAPVWLWGLRAGCLLAAAAADPVDDDVNFLFWQPATSGAQLLQQFLRLKAANAMIEGSGKGVVDGLKKTLAAGQSVEIAGYELSAALAKSLAGASLDPVARASRVIWLETSTRADASLSPAATLSIERWRAKGAAVHAQVVSGPPFWQTTEMEEAPALIAGTLAALEASVETLEA